MAKVACSFRCMICEDRLQFPDAIELSYFLILIQKFYEKHDLCEVVVTPNVIQTPSLGEKQEELTDGS